MPVARNIIAARRREAECLQCTRHLSRTSARGQEDVCFSLVVVRTNVSGKQANNGTTRPPRQLTACRHPISIVAVEAIDKHVAERVIVLDLSCGNPCGQIRRYRSAQIDLGIGERCNLRRVDPSCGHVGTNGELLAGRSRMDSHETGTRVLLSRLQEQTVGVASVRAAAGESFAGKPAMPRGITNAADRKGGFALIATTSLRCGGFSPRTSIATDKTILELAESIATSGMIEPIVVREAEADLFQVVAGERRLKAAQSLGLTSVPCIVRDCSDAEALVISLTENLQRSDLNPIEKARGSSREAIGQRQLELTGSDN